MNFRTDLAIEIKENIAPNLPDGVKFEEYQKEHVTISRIEITNQEAAKVMEKPIGHYVTVTVPPFSTTTQSSDSEMEVVAQEIQNLLPEKGLVLVVGLGNYNITPDALGPKTISQILATRHVTEDINAGANFGFLRPVAAISPGVLGQTGIEVAEITASIVRDIKPAAVIIIDSLASMSLSRLGCTIQISNTGISPGSGVFNKRKELSRETLGVPVLSLGIPTVVDATTLVCELLSGSMKDNIEEIKRNVEPRGEKMMITPREIDLLVERAAKVLSFSINKALQPGVSNEDLIYLTA
ncbi:GPR endopeptidase [Candidatus Soleaferrea massiliensis]|uniref:GPR endopeptidase n=1 Tax=Candidatus Soleaferrea massiliensis TaxID=1470354 RepID=UPI00058C4426|nr:GPR endopeptidase [Candidatus Soleaferrea massiliensis]